MAEEEVGVIIARAERLRIPRTLNSGRLAKLKAFKTRIPEWEKATAEVYDEPIIVTLKVKRELRTDGVIPYEVERTFDHFHADVVRFEELVDRSKGAGKALSIKDGVLAYLIVFKRGSRHLIAGFLWALRDKYSEFKEGFEVIRTKETYVGLDGVPREREVVHRVRRVFASAQEMVSTVGQELSRLRSEGWLTVGPTEEMKPPTRPITRYPPGLPKEEEYHGP